MEITTIKLLKSTKLRIDKFRTHKRDTYEEIIQKMLEILNLARINPEAAKSKLAAIENINRQIIR